MFFDVNKDISGFAVTAGDIPSSEEKNCELTSIFSQSCTRRSTKISEIVMRFYHCVVLLEYRQQMSVVYQERPWFESEMYKNFKILFMNRGEKTGLFL